MFFVSVRLNKQNRLMAFVAGIVIVMLTVAFCNAGSVNKNVDTFEKRADFLEQFNIDIVNCEEDVTEVIVPDRNDKALIKYNSIQSCCGFDLSAYSGEAVNRFSYLLPDNKKIVSLMVADGHVVGGDIYDTEKCVYISLCGEETNGDN